MNVGSVLTLKTDELTQAEWLRVFKSLRFQDNNKVVYEPWIVNASKRQVKLPRGSWNYLPESVTYNDKRHFPNQAELEFSGQLDSEGFSGQVDALKSMLTQEQGLVIAQPGFGKTEVALAFAACCETPTLVLVHTQDILEQWVERAKKLLPKATIGRIQGSHTEYGHVTITTVQTFRKRLRSDPEMKWKFGAVILDEAHHAPASTFDEILGKMPAKYRFGFTATDSRADGKHPYMKLIIGPVIYRKKFKSKVPVKVVPIKSHNFKYHWRGSWDWRGLVDALISDDARNQIIASVADAEIRDGHSILILSREINHLHSILKLMNEITRTDVLTGEKTKAERIRILDGFRSGMVKCLLATQLADEALDVPILSRIILTYPGKHDGRIIQQVGRALREHPLKTEAIIYDVVDDKVGVLRYQWMQRKQAYKKMKIKVQKVRVK